VQASLSAVRDKARLEAEDVLKSKIAEKATQIAGMHRQIEDLRRRAEQGSQQLQGETQELELESLLRARFPRDLVEPVPNGSPAPTSSIGCSVKAIRPAARFCGRPHHSLCGPRRARR